MEKFFKLKQAGTTVKTEIFAGITTFVTMAYIIFVNPGILSAAGMDPNAVMVATCIASAIGTLLIGLLSNYPFAQAPGMGLNAFFAYTICLGMGYSWQAGLAAVFVAGCIFIVITITGLRTAIVNAIPQSLKKAIGVGIGLFIAYIGMNNVGWIDFSAGVPAFTFTSPVAIMAVIGLVITVALVVLKVKGALLLGIVATSAIGAFAQYVLGIDLGMGMTSTSISLAPTLGKFWGGFSELFSFGQGFGIALISIFTVLISLTIVDMFDTIGTLIGTAQKADMLDENGNLPRIEKAMMADAIATSAGAVLGTSTVTTYVESSAGVSYGGRTGLTSVVVAILFVFSIFLAPVLGFIQFFATAPVLIVVGIMMMSGVKDIDWTDFGIAVPAFLTIVSMPFSYSIANGISTGFIFYTLIALISGKGKKVSPVMYVFAALFIVRYILLAV